MTGATNNHPTVKPLDLMRYLCKLLAPPSGGLFLEPFAGSGTTLIACKALNIRAVGIELSEEYAEIAAKRLSQDVLELI
jgi:site-specific DNA-methyltransferase (adenine-specific)